ncbi:MAG: thiamine phosphate synthase [Alphaproteobacteria bacterium]|nr:MAG: thiamine phosphate synthase [Alphaproteobacteria bacterium]
MPNIDPPCRLYLISPPKIILDDFAPRLEAALGAGDVAAFQLRLKPADDEEIYNAAEALLPICNKFHVLLILNDRTDLARDVGADGVHLGQSDGSVPEARAKLGLDAMIGVTCHNSRHLAFLAGDAGADYVAFGAFFPTKTKATKFTAEPELLSWWSDISEIPAVAIGGIIPENCLALITAGAHFLAVSSGVWDHPGGPGEAVKAFNKLMARHSPG